MADRSVSISLRAKVADFISGMGQAKRSTEDLSRQMVQTGAYAAEFRRRMEAAVKALPKIEIDADSSPAEIKFAELRAEMEKLADKKIGIDIDAASAKTQLDEIQRKLQALSRQSATVDVKADIGTALTQLQALNTEVSRVDGRRANVDVNADVGGALAGIGMVGAALAALPAVTTVAVGVMALGGAFAAAGIGAAAFGAATVPVLGRINEALKETETASGGAGGAMKSAGQSAAEAASKALQLAQAQDRVKDSARAVKDAQQSVRDAVADVGRAQGDAARAAEDAADRQAQAASRITDAERSIQDAHRATQRAIEDLTRAREQAQERIEDLALATERGALSEERAQLSIQRAQADLARVNSDPKASSYDKSDADLRLREAELSLKEIQERNGDLSKEREESDKKGVEGSDEVVAAKERILDAQRAETDAERSLADARAESAKVARDGAREVAAAQDKIAEAQRKVADAQQAVIKAQRDQLRATQALKVEQLQQAAATDKAGSAASGAATKMSKLSDAEQVMAKNIKSFKDEYVAWQQALEPDTFAVVNQGLDLMRLGLQEASPLARSASSALLTFGKDAETALTGAFWQTFLFNVNTQIPGAITGLGKSFINVSTGVAGVIQAFLPFTPTVVGGIERASEAFSKWGQELGGSNDFKEFMAWAQANAPEVWKDIQNIAAALVSTAKAIAPLSMGAFSGLGLLADLVAGMDPAHIQAIALAIGAIKLAAMGMSAVKSWQGLAGGIDATGAAAGKTSGKMAALGKAAIGISAAVVGFEATGAVLSKISGQSAGIDKLTLALTELGQSGKWSGDLNTQWEHAFDDAGDASKRFADGLRELQDPSFGEVYWLHPLSEITALLPGLDSEVDRLEQKFSDVDTSLAGMVTSGNAAGAAKAFQQFAKQATDAGIPVSKLQELLPTYSQAVRVAGNASAAAAVGVDTAKQKVDGFNKSLTEFSGRTDALTALSKLKDAYNDAKNALDAANGKLQVNSKMTDDQRTAVINAREKFAGYIDSVKTAADAAFTLTGRTGESTKTVLEQLPHLGTLAGKNSEAKEQVLLLAKAFGISREDAIKAMKSTEDMEKVLAKLKSKEIKIGLTLDTSAAEKEFGSFLDRYSNKSLAVAIATKVKAAGGIQTAAGVDLMAAGGVRPNIATSATYLPGSNTVYGEAGKEAYIPYDPSNRERAIAILGQVAQDFGLSVYNPNAQQQVTDMVSGLSTANTSITVNLANATRTLDSTLGSSGSLTQTVSGVGDRTQAVGTAVSAVASTMDVGTLKIVASTDKVGTSALAVADVVAKAANLIASAAAKAGGASAGSTNVPKPAAATKNTGASAGSVLGYNPNTASSNGMKPGTYTTGDYGSAGFAGGLVSVQGGYSSASATNSSTVSRAQQLVSSSNASSGSSSGGGSSSSSGGASVNFYGTQIRESMDVDVVTAKIGVAIGGRG